MAKDMTKHNRPDPDDIAHIIGTYKKTDRYLLAMAKILLRWPKDQFKQDFDTHKQHGSP